MSSVIERKETAVAQVATPATMLQTALERGASMEQLEKLLDLQERWERNEARKAFVQAMTEFKKNPPSIVKDKTVGFDTREGSKTQYKHATLASIVDAVVLEMSKHGLSHSWSINQAGREITVTCVITHVAGHSESVSMTAQPDDSGKKNPIQQVASTVTYLQRYTLMSACGLAAKDQVDDDGRGGGPKKTATIRDEQAAEIKQLLQETNSDVLAFLQFAGADCVETILETAYPQCLRLLLAKREKQRASA